MEIRKKTGFVLGPLSFLSVYFYPFLSQNPRAHRLLAIFLLIVVWWVTECIPIPITALLVPILITVFQVAPVKEAFAPFANPIIMLFLGSFILARAMSAHSLDRKLAYYILSLKSIGQKRSRILLALGLTSAFLSLWISNTATTAMMFPICLGILTAFGTESKEGHNSSFKVIILLMIAYSASVGGIGTPIGSPPNLIAIGLLEKLANYRITFFQWMVIGFMVIIPMYSALYLFMKFKLGKNKESEKNKFHLPSIERGQEKFSRGQKNVLAAFLV
ncbi:MAG: SLC13 family permease, partial [Candidatus Aminicenantales bacterium]